MSLCYKNISHCSSCLTLQHLNDAHTSSYYATKVIVSAASFMIFLFQSFLFKLTSRVKGRYQMMLFHLNQYNVYTERIVFHLFVCFHFQQSVLAALYSSEGSVMEVNSQPVTSQGCGRADWKQSSNNMMCLYTNVL